MVCELYLNEAALKKNKKHCLFGPVLSNIPLHFGPESSTWLLFSLVALYLKCAFNKHFTSRREAGVYSSLSCSALRRSLAPPRTSASALHTDGGVRQSPKSSCVKRLMHLRNSIQNVVYGETCCHLKVYCKSVYTTIKLIYFPASYNVPQPKIGYKIKEAYRAWQIGYHFRL